MDINHLLRGEQVALLRAQFAPCPDTRRSQLRAAGSFADQLRTSEFPWRAPAGGAVAPDRTSITSHANTGAIRAMLHRRSDAANGSGSLGTKGSWSSRQG